MTTTVVNNSVFRAFFEKQKLSGPNFMDWYRQLRIVLSAEDNLNYLELPILATLILAVVGHQVPPETLAAHTAWVKGQKEIAVLMLMTMEPDLQENLETLGAYDMLKELKTLFAHQAEQELLQTVREFHACKQIRKGKSKLTYAPKPKIPPPPKKEDPAKDLVCHHCGDTCHWKWNCPQYLSELLKNKKLPQGASTSGIFTIELFTFPGKSWVYDTGCGTHICNTTQGSKRSRKLKPGALSLYIGNGQRVAVEAIGSYELCFPSGLVIVLHNCHYAPSKTRGVISVSRLDGIFEIVLSNSNTNDCSIYDVSNKRAKLKLDSSLLWHCRLGYISKKHIKKLQHDGLLNSIDTKSFEKCVSCLSGKMARKPYSHQVEMAKDLLGVIYTDNAKFFENSLITQEASGSLEDLEIIQEEDTHPSKNPSPHDDEDNQEIHKLQSDIIPIHRSTRTRHAPDRMFDLPPNGKTVGSKWLFKKKTGMDGAVHTYKGRLVAKGFTQTPRIDYEETFSPVADIRAIRILIAITAIYDYKIWQIDVKTAFLNGYLYEEVYMEQPKASESYVTFLILYVDDILIMGNNIPMLQDVKSYLGRCFAMKDLGEAAYILGIKIYKDKSKRLIGLCQSAYIEKILKRYFIKNSKRGSIPMQEKLKLSKSQGVSTPAEVKRMQNVPYASAVGSIMYVVRCTRPDVAFAQNITSQFQQNPDMFLDYGDDIKRELRVSCYTDAGYLTDADDLMSQTGYVFVLNKGAANWKSTKQSIFATSSTEAEYIAASDASKEAVWIRKFIYGLGVLPTIEEQNKDVL
ncbi:retrotransposon protein, putative, ty1-copia subclass [Tanacetum coccineum]